MKVLEEIAAEPAPDAGQGRPMSIDAYLGRRLGPYVLVQRIGEGGMGVVYRARPTASHHDVAVKVVKRGMDTEVVLRRFENERRILTALDHPNICRLLGGGTTADGLPYFVMEYIDGQPIRSYCDSANLSVEDRLRLFLKICSAVQRAHELGVIHRDIKPENILVTRDGEPKLLDFGIAKLLDATPGSQEVTVTVGRLMTPFYASPEQARGAAVTAATDVYSLGVMLYELLTGASPYNTADETPQALVEAVRQQQPRLASAVVARSMRRRIRGNLDAILLTALAKDPAQRYLSVSNFADDVGRHLTGARVHARSIPVRLKRWRFRPRHVAALLVVACLATAGSVHRWPTVNSTPVRPGVALLGFENVEHEPSEEWLGAALTEMLSSELSAGGGVRIAPGELVSRVRLEFAVPHAQTLTPTTLRRLNRSLHTDYIVLGSYLVIGRGLDELVRVDLRLQDARSGDLIASLCDTSAASALAKLAARAGAMVRRELGAGKGEINESFARSSVPEDVEAARQYAEGVRRLRAFDTLAARDLLRNAVTAAPRHAQSHAALAVACSLLGYDVEARDEATKAVELSGVLPEEDRLSIQGRFFQTTRQWSKAIETFRLLRREYPDNLEYGLQLAAVQSQAGDAREALETVRSLRSLPFAANDPRVDLAEAEAAIAASDLPFAGAAAHRTAESAAAEGFRILTAQAHLLEGRIALQSGDPRRALAAIAEAQRLFLMAGHRQGVAWALNESAGVLTQRGDVAAARARYEEALEVCRTIGDQTCIATDLDSIGVLRRRQGDLRGALSMHSEAMEVRRAVGDLAGVATCLYNIANVLGIIGDLSGAEKAAAEALEIRERVGERRVSALSRLRLANIRRQQGDMADALNMTELAVSELEAVGDRGGVALATFDLGLVLFDSGKLPRSRTVLEDALAIRRRQQDKNNAAQILAALAKVALAQDRLSEAEAMIGESISLRQGLSEAISLATSKLVLADILLYRGRIFAAEQAAREAAKTFHDAGAWGPEGDARLAVADAQLHANDIFHARASIDMASTLLRESKNAQTLLRRDTVLARLDFLTGQQSESTALLDRALDKAKRLGLAGTYFQLRLARAQILPSSVGRLGMDAHAGGFLLIEREANALGARRHDLAPRP